MDDSLPRPVWRASLALPIVALILTAVLLALALFGISNPHPLGDLAVDATPAGATLIVDAPRTQRLIPSLYSTLAPATVELTARLADGPPAAGYGLWVGPSEEQAVVVAVSGTGYLTVATIVDGELTPVENWQRYVHVRPAGESNWLRLDVAEDGVTVWINDEWALEFEPGGDVLPPGEPLRVGFFVETFAEGGAKAAFERLMIWEGAAAR